MSERTKKVVELFKSAQPRKKKTDSPSAPIQTAVGNGNIQVAGDWQGDLKVNTKEIHRHEFTPGPEHITREQAYKLRELVYKAADIEAVTGRYTVGELRTKWWNRLGKRYKASPYQAIPAEFGEAAIAWLTQEVAKLRPKLRRRDPEAWKKEHYTAIWARTKELGLSKPDVYVLATTKLDRIVTSLTQLNQQELKKFYNIIMGMPKNR
ncbi:MAG: hypothetical protein ACYC6G_18980 [Desulfobaccales bacterium]